MLRLPSPVYLSALFPIVLPRGTYHANLSVREREALSTVRERHRSFTGGVECSEDIDEHSDQTKVCWAALRNEEA